MKGSKVRDILGHGGISILIRGRRRGWGWSGRLDDMCTMGSLGIIRGMGLGL